MDFEENLVTGRLGIIPQGKTERLKEYIIAWISPVFCFSVAGVCINNR